MEGSKTMGGDGWGLASDVVVLTQPTSFPVPNHHRYEQVISDESFQDLEELQLIQLQGTDIKGRILVRIVGKYFPAPVIDKQCLQRYAASKLAPFQGKKFAIVYFHTTVQRDENSPGIRALKQIYDGLSPLVRSNLETVYFVHPGIRSRLLLATLGRFFLSDGLYWKIQYVSRVEFLRDHIKDGELEVPEFVWEHDEELEDNPLIDYGICADPIQAELKAQGNRYPASHSPIY